jgi:hypothetical protein
MIIQISLGIIVYYYIVLPTKRRKRDDDKIAAAPSAKTTTTTTTTTMEGFLIGFGIIIPISLIVPFLIIDYCDIRNVAFRLGWCSLPMTLSLRTFEAMFGFVPSKSKESLCSFILHVGFILQPKYDTTNSNIIPATIQSRNHVIIYQYLFWLCIMTMGYHWFYPTNFLRFSRSDIDTLIANDKLIYWDVPHIYDTFIQATMMNLSLSLSMTGVSSLATMLTNKQFDDHVTNHPMILSESVSDFWGRRWNNLIHVGLKQGIYKPVRRYTLNPTIASLAAFVMSGIYHEYVWLLLFTPTSTQQQEASFEGVDCCTSCYCESWFGKQLLFFGWNGILIAFEYLIGGYMSQYTSRLPRLVKSHLIVLLSLPVGHLFTHDLLASGYFTHLASAIPRLNVTKLQ